MGELIPTWEDYLRATRPIWRQWYANNIANGPIPSEDGECHPCGVCGKCTCMTHSGVRTWHAFLISEGKHHNG
jgi:hypothetical protein